MQTAFVLLGVLLSAPAFLLSWIGTKTFVRGDERLLAVALTLVAGLSLILSVVLIFNPAVQRIQALSLGLTTALLAAALFVAKVRGRRGHPID